VLLVADDPSHSGAAAGDARIAIAITLIVVALSVIGLPTVQFCHWVWRLHALLDPLTSLLNRRGLDYQLSQIFRGRTGSAYAATVDIDRFKVVNDTFGHQFGDEVLQLTATCLHSTAGSDAIVARTGGEEFVVVGWLHGETVEAIAERLRSAVETMPGLPLVVTASVGATAFPVCDLLNPVLLRQILRRSDTAMYEAKSAGGNVAVIEPLYDPAAGIAEFISAPLRTITSR
jgi:diguanylate cyclase (GGDEF)-like protein